MLFSCFLNNISPVIKLRVSVISVFMLHACILPSGDENLIRETRNLSNLSILTQDTAGIAKFWTQDYHVITSRNFERSGIIANRDRLAEEFNGKPDVVYIRNTETIEVFKDWGMASEYGNWIGRWTEEGIKVELTGRYFAKWHFVGGRWLIRAEIFVPLTCSGPSCDRKPLVF